MCHKKWVVYASLYLIMILSNYSYSGQEDFYKNHCNGWHWYKDMRKEEDKKTQDEIQKKQRKERLKKSHERANAIREEYDAAREDLTTDPTEENIVRFLILQRLAMQQTDRLSNNWKKVHLKYPELDYSLENPENNTARQIAAQEEIKKEEAAIKRLGAQSGLFFFYRSNCPYCRGFAPTVKLFAETYGIHVIAITTDGISLPEFPNSFSDQGQAAKFNVKAEPALFAVNPYTQKAYPVAYGMISFSDLRRKILEVSDQLVEGNSNGLH